MRCRTIVDGKVAATHASDCKATRCKRWRGRAEGGLTILHEVVDRKGKTRRGLDAGRTLAAVVPGTFISLALALGPDMSPAGSQILTASQLVAAGTPAPSSQIRPSPLARASSLFQQVHLAAPPSSAAHHGRSNSSPLNSADGSSPTRTGFQFELPTLRVPDGLRLPDGMRLPDGIRLPDFDLPKFELGPAWAQFRARYVSSHQTRAQSAGPRSH